MDSLTQFALGGIVGCATLKNISKKTILISGLIATIPDLDVLLKPFYADGNFVVVHRSFSHSLLCNLLLSGLLSTCIVKQYTFKLRFQYCFYILFTHALLDCCTTYGTQLFWPFSRELISFNNIHVLEPIYTFCLLLPLLWVAIAKKSTSNKLIVIYGALILSTTYLGWTFVSKSIAKQVVIDNLIEQQINYEEVLITPTPFNSLLWKAIIKKDSTYYFSSYSLLDKEKKMMFYEKKHQPKLLKVIAGYCDVQTMLRHCDGYPFVEGGEEQIRIYAIKFGPANYLAAPIFIMPFEAKKIKSDNYDFSIIDNRFDANKVHQFNRELITRIKGN